MENNSRKEQVKLISLGFLLILIGYIAQIFISQVSMALNIAAFIMFAIALYKLSKNGYPEVKPAGTFCIIAACFILAPAFVLLLNSQRLANSLATMIKFIENSTLIDESQTEEYVRDLFLSMSGYFMVLLQTTVVSAVSALVGYAAVKRVSIVTSNMYKYDLDNNAAIRKYSKGFFVTATTATIMTLSLIAIVAIGFSMVSTIDHIFIIIPVSILAMIFSIVYLVFFIMAIVNISKLYGAIKKCATDADMAEEVEKTEKELDSQETNDSEDEYKF